jgi:hypothetical protein
MKSKSQERKLTRTKGLDRDVPPADPESSIRGLVLHPLSDFTFLHKILSWHWVKFSELPDSVSRRE